jgi:hypothetical protein
VLTEASVVEVKAEVEVKVEVERSSNDALGLIDG